MTRKELIGRFPELSKKKFWAPINEQTGTLYNDGKKVYILDPLSGLYHHLNISSDAIRDIFTDLTKLASVVDYFRTDTKEPFEFCFEKNNGVLDSYSLSKYEIIKGIEELLSTGEIGDRQAANSAFNTLLPLVSNSVLLERYKDQEYTISLDGTEYTIPTCDIVSLFLSPQATFSNTISQDEINGIPTDRYLHALSQFVFKEAISESYYLTDAIAKRCQKLNEFRERDFEAVNKFVTTENPYLDKIAIHPELEKTVLADMPEDYSTMEKAIYIYLKMCQTLTYDPEFYMVDQRGPLTEKHRKVENTALITPENNRIVCYEFSAIYSKFLAGLNIPHRLFRTQTDRGEEVYGRGHFRTDFRCGKYIVSADSITSILCSDLTSAKTDMNVHGIDALNQNKGTRIEFRNTLQKVIADIKEQQYGVRPKEVDEEDADVVLYEPGFNEFQSAVDEYAAVRPVLEQLPFDARVQIMFEQLERQGLEGVDAHSYLLQLRKSLFTPEEQEKNIDITILRHNTREEDHPVDIVSVITTSEDYRNPDAPMSYILYSVGCEPRPLEKEDMEKLMSNETVQYYTYPMKRLPGIFPNDTDEACARYLGLFDD